MGVINRVDGIFKNTDWSDGKGESLKDFGFVIKKVGNECHSYPRTQVLTLKAPVHRCSYFSLRC